MEHTGDSSTAVIRFHLPAWSVCGLLGLAMMLVLIFGPAAHASSGPYIGIGGGFSLMEDANVSAPYRDGTYPPLDATTSIDTGYAVRGTAGYAFVSGLRAEVDISYQENDTTRMNVKSPGALGLVAYGRVRGLPPAELREEYAALPAQQQSTYEEAAKGTSRIRGDITMFTVWANAFYDFDLQSAWKPYVGGGLGFARVSIDAKSKVTGSSLADDEDTVFAYQIGAGLGYALSRSQERALTATLDWRYFSSDDPALKGDVTGTKFHTEIDGHYAGAGIRYSF